jgi:CPA1 family monovalent cation:H+ antiporter
VPPLLYLASFNTSFRDFTAQLWPIIRLGVVLVLVSIAAVAWAAHRISPEFTWAAAFALGAIISPPDPIAATAVMRTLGAPRRLVNILEGEGLVNDATALIAYRLAVAAAVTQTFSPSRAAGGLLLSAAGGLAIGLATGWAIVWVRGRVRAFPIVENVLSLLTPFIAYLPADAIGVSGVISVVTVGLYVARQTERFGSAAARVQAEAMWSMLGFLLESLVFILIGLELRSAVHALQAHTLQQLLWYAVVISGVVIAVRLLWVWPSAYLPRLIARTRRFPPWRWVLFVGWAGMRGADSLVIALALPVRFPARDLILQGLTLRPLLRLLGISDEGVTESEEAHARRVIAEAGLRQLEQMAPRDARHLREEQQRKIALWSARDQSAHGTDDPEHRALPSRGGKEAERKFMSQRELRLAMLDAERKALVELRDEEVISDEIMRLILRELDLETMLLEAAKDDAPPSPYEMV